MRTITLLSLCGLLVLGLFFFADRGESDNGPSLFGIPLVPPIFAQSGGSTLPDPDAGLSSYIQRDPSLIDFAKIIPVLNETIDGGENYLIGSVNILRNKVGATPAPPSIQVRLYIDKDGFIVAYLTKEKIAADIFRWDVSDLPADPLDTALSDALTVVTTAIGASSPTDASWYHWNYPSATHFSAAAKRGIGNMYMRIPTGAIFSENPSYSWHSIRTGFGNTTGILTLETMEGTRTELEPPQGPSSRFNIGGLSSIIAGERYIFEIKPGIGGSSNNFLGVAVIYQIP